MITLEEMQEMGAIPQGEIPAIISEIRDLVYKEKGTSKLDQELIKERKYSNYTPVKPKNSENKVAIHIDNVSKIFDTKLKKSGVRKKEKRKYIALENVSFDVHRGEVVGLMGTNGSGKSTLLKMITQISECTKGTITIDGMPWLVPAKVNMKENLTGEQNIEYRCALMGFRPQKIAQVKDEVIKFSELGNLMYNPVKGYSSGEKSRLGFAITLSMSPDIYIIDEALSVGDDAFKSKCFDKMKEISESDNETVLFVSHNINEVQQLCTRAVWIENGKMIEDGDVTTVTAHYAMYTGYKSELPKDKKTEFSNKKQTYRDLSLEEWRKHEYLQ